MGQKGIKLEWLLLFIQGFIIPITKKYAYALAHQMSFVWSNLFWPKKVHFKRKIYSILNLRKKFMNVFWSTFLGLIWSGVSPF